MIDPSELGTGQEPTPQGEGGSPPPDPKDAEIAKLRDQLSDAEGRNAKLREERRKDRATTLGQELKLDAPTVELLQSLPADQMEARAKAIAEARGAPPPTPAPSTDPPPAQPQEGQQPPATPPPTDPNVEAMGKGGDGTPAPVASDANADLQTRLQGKSVEEMRAIQEELKAKERERNRV